MTVSVILPTYNRGYIIAEAIRSVLNQTFANFELIIVDDGSTDNTLQVVESFSDPRIKLLCRPENGGVAAALNTGLKAVKGDFVAIFNSDDLWHSQKLALQTLFLFEHPEVGGVFSDVKRVAGDTQTPSLLHAYHPEFIHLLSTIGLETEGILPQRDLYLCLLQEMPVKIQAALLRTANLTAVGYFDESWRCGEDWEFILRFAKTNTMAYQDLPLTTMRTLPDSTLTRLRKADATNLMNRFIQEKQQLRGDSAAISAVRRGIAAHSRELGHQYRHEGQRYEAFRAYRRGYVESHDIGLLIRAFATTLPPPVWTAAQRVLSSRSS